MPVHHSGTPPVPPPAPRRRDRRAGWRSARLHGALRQPSRTGAPARRAPGRREALARLRSRYRPSTKWYGIALTVAAAGLVAAFVGAAAESRHRVPLDEDRAGYAALAAALAAECPEGRCEYGADLSGRRRAEPPARLRSVMGRLRVLTASYDNGLAEAEVTGILGRERLLYRDPAPTPEQRRRRERWQAFEARPTAPGPPPEPLGGGWYRERP